MMVAGETLAQQALMRTRNDSLKVETLISDKRDDLRAVREMAIRFVMSEKRIYRPLAKKWIDRERAS